MADIATDIHRLADAARAGLDDLHDDYVQTRMVWQAALVEARRGPREFQAVYNPMTKTVVRTAEELASRSRNSQAKLRARCFKDLVAQFELFVGSLLRIWLGARSELLEEKALTLSTILSSTDIAVVQAAAVAEAIESTIADKLYGRPAKWLNYLRRNLQVSFPIEDESDFVEMKARRDALEHHDGKIDETYISKSGQSARYRPGERVDIGESDVDQAYELVRRLISLTETAAVTDPTIP